MPTPVKPCEGEFTEDLQAVLTSNRNREQWAVHTCHICGAPVGAVKVQGKWIPEQHWPSVTYPPRTETHAASSRFVASTKSKGN
jgi:hypothetical protein